MCEAECNNTQNIINSTEQLQPFHSMPMRVNVTMAITQLLVWPFIYTSLLMLYTFSKKQAFKTETRYILFAHTLLVDLVFLLLTDFVVILSYSHVLLPVMFCIPFGMLMEMLTSCTTLTITAMCVERYVAICMPLRHNAISTPSRTFTVILTIWILSSIKPFVDMFILVATASQEYLSEITVCNYEVMTPEKWQRLMRGIVYIITFILILLVEIFCYVMIVFAARAASVDKKSAAKGLRTVFLHMVQLTLCTAEIICPYIEAVVMQIDFQLYLTVRYFNFITFSIIARAMSPLVYGLRDEHFFAALVCYVRCRLNIISANNRERNR